jgi:Nuclear transport factor 2 (NTF2) domain.
MGLPTPQEVQQLMQRYVERVDAGDIEGILALYAEDAKVEDPVGSTPLRGIEAIAAFYRQGLGTLQVSAALTGPVRATCDGQGAVPFRVVFGGRALDVIDVMAFDAQGLIRSMKAYWSEVNVGPA